MNWHEVIDERSYEMHQVVADVLRRDPEKLRLVRNWIHERMADRSYSVHSKEALQERILRRYESLRPRAHPTGV